MTKLLELLGEGKCMTDIGGAGRITSVCKVIKSFEEGKQYVIEKLIHDEFPHMNYRELSWNDNRKMTSFMPTVCHETVETWKKEYHGSSALGK